MDKVLLSPPIVFALLLIFLLLCSGRLSRYSRQLPPREHETDAYACGQRGVKNYISPDYSQFFPFAFFFTIMHVLVLAVATAPADALLLPSVFIAVALFLVVIIFKR
ncbi:MAG: hypothetical protein RR232_02930 [Clostridia bacterium]